MRRASVAVEECIASDPNKLALIEVGGGFKLAEGAHWLPVFGPYGRRSTALRL